MSAALAGAETARSVVRAALLAFIWRMRAKNSLSWRPICVKEGRRDKEDKGAFDRVGERLNSIDRRIDSFMQRVDARFNALDTRFHWLIGIVVGTWITHS